MFTGVVNPCTGKLEWVQQDNDVTSERADISRELARSQYGDMLLDKERNCLYQRGLELAVAEIKASGREPHVLDIGTGTGLLAMMAAKAGAKRVTACEVLRPMARIAHQVISQNGYSDVVRIVPKRSTDMTEVDMVSKANILVSEVFDTELIGEGALVTFAHAHKHLLEPDSVVVPSSSRMYIRLIESDFLWRSHKLIPEKFPVDIKLPSSWEECAGPPGVWDLHVEEVKIPEQMKPLSESIEIANFQFCDPALSSDCTSSPVDVTISEDGTCHGVVIWWDIKLGDHILTMDPWNYQHWRDHWLEAVQLWSKPLQLTKGELVKAVLQHDDYSVWFSVNRPSSMSISPSIERPLCTCGVHTACSRNRISMYNDTERTNLYMQTLCEVLVGKSTIVCVGDGCLLPLLLLLNKFSGHFYALSNSSHSVNIVRQLIEANGLLSSITFLEKSHFELTVDDFKGKQIDAIIGEPYFSSSLLPWHNLHFWYAVNSIQKLMAPIPSNHVVFPGKGHVMAIAVAFSDLYKLRASVGFVEGFNITAFDQAVEKHTTTPEGIEAEPHPLWEYSSYARSGVHDLMTFDFSAAIPSNTLLEENGEMVLDCSPCHAVVLWMEYTLTEITATTASTGLKHEPGSKSERLEWDPSFKQAVYFLSPKYTHQSLAKLDYHIEFSTASGNIDMTISGIH